MEYYYDEKLIKKSSELQNSFLELSEILGDLIPLIADSPYEVFLLLTSIEFVRAFFHIKIKRILSRPTDSVDIGFFTSHLSDCVSGRKIDDENVKEAALAAFSKMYNAQEWLNHYN